MEKNKALEFELNPAFQRLKFVNQFPQNESTSTTISSINNTKIEDNTKFNRTFFKKSSFDYNTKNSMNDSKIVYKKNFIQSKNNFSSLTPIKKSMTQKKIEFDFDTNLTSSTNFHLLNDTNSDFNTSCPLKKKSTFDYDSLDFSEFELYGTNKPKNTSAIINLEELLILEEKLTAIFNCVSNSMQCYDECFEWWNFYFNSSICNQFPNYFVDQDSKEIVTYSTNLEFLTIILCYDLSFNENAFITLSSYLKEALLFHHSNFILLCNNIVSKIMSSRENIWVVKLQKLVEKYNNLIQKSIAPVIYQVKSNCSNISNIQRIILKNYDSNRSIVDDLTYIYKNIKATSLEEINRFYREKVIRVLNQNGSILASSTSQNQRDTLIKNAIQIPYLNKESLKKYTLVLDLDETLIHFKVEQNDEGTGFLHFRPGLFDFLEKVGNYYEIVLFTAATKDYANPIIDAIEQNKIYFDYRLYREHTVILGNDFVKDISKLGREMSKIIIVDNMPQSFRLQKDNGVFIRAYWGKAPDDCALIDLMPILINIAKEGWDVRQGLRFYKDEIINKVTSNFYRKQLC